MLLLCVCAFFTWSITASAQSTGEGSYLKLSARRVDGGDSKDLPAGTYVFSQAEGFPVSCVQEEGNDYAEITFSGQFTRKGEDVFITGELRIYHPAKGSFSLRNGKDKEDPVNLLRAAITVNNGKVLMDQAAGCQGSITLDTYQRNKLAAGHFEIVLSGSIDPDKTSDLYKLSGVFRLAGG